MNSLFGTINLTDFGKGLLVAVLTAVLTVLYQSLSAGSLTVDVNAIALAAATAGVAYILKNLGTNSEGKVLKTEPKK